MAIIGTPIINLLFKQIDKSITETANQKDITKTSDTKSARSDEQTEKNTKVNFKTIFDKELKRQVRGNKHKADQYLEDLKKKKEIKPFYIIPKNKNKGESLFVKRNKKIWEKSPKKLEREISPKEETNRLLGMDNRHLLEMPGNINLGKKPVLALKNEFLKPIKEKSREDIKNPVKIKLVVVDLREKKPIQKSKKTLKNNTGNKIKGDHRLKESNSELKIEKSLSKEEIKLVVKHRDNTESLPDYKTDYTVKNVDNKQAQAQFSQLQKNLSAELVKHTRLIIKNGGNGEIRLMLKPESLGNMRVKINIQDNNIVGKIFVENNIVKALIENSLQNLYDSLKEDGFREAMINVFVGSEGEQGKTQGNELESASHGKSRHYWEDESAFDKELIQFDSLVNIVL